MATHVEAMMDLELKVRVESMVGADGSATDPGITDVMIEVLDTSAGRPYRHKMISIFEGVPPEAVAIMKMNILEAELQAIRDQIEFKHAEGRA